MNSNLEFTPFQLQVYRVKEGLTLDVDKAINPTDPHKYSMDSLCSVCGKTYGNHYLLDCKYTREFDLLHIPDAKELITESQKPSIPEII